MVSSFWSNVAVTVTSSRIVTLQPMSVPVHPPPSQPMNTTPGGTTADSCTITPGGTSSEHADPQSRPDAENTEPSLALPASTMVTVRGSGVWSSPPPPHPAHAITTNKP